MLSQRTTALTAAVTSKGIRVYTKTKDGDVREGCNNTTEVQLSNARWAIKLSPLVDLSSLLPSPKALDVIDHGDGWSPGL
jgi:hypothetical protein